MHKTVKDELSKWYEQNKNILIDRPIADLGSYNINGSVKDIIVNATGFDIYEGKNVDVVIKPGLIPSEHKNNYVAVTTVSSFQFCPDSKIYIDQILDLLCDNGLLFLTMCGDKCKSNHSTSPNIYGYGDSVRYKINELSDLFSKSFDIVEIYEMDNGHHDIILKAKKK